MEGKSLQNYNIEFFHLQEPLSRKLRCRVFDVLYKMWKRKSSNLWVECCWVCSNWSPTPRRRGVLCSWKWAHSLWLWSRSNGNSKWCKKTILQKTSHYWLTCWSSPEVSKKRTRSECFCLEFLYFSYWKTLLSRLFWRKCYKMSK